MLTENSPFTAHSHNLFLLQDRRARQTENESPAGKLR